MTVVRLEGGGLFLHSPSFLTEALRRELDDLGEVAFVVSPNKLHHQGLEPVLRAHPRARCFAPPGLPERRPDLRFAGVLDDTPHPGWAETLDQVVTRGNVFFAEVLFLHRSSRTLIVGDLVENFEKGTTSRAGRVLASLFGVGSHPVASPEFRLYTHDPDAAWESLQPALAWDFERIVLAHGGLIQEDAPRVFRAVCEDLVRRARRRGPLGRRLLAAAARWQ
jgi:hypothetical protein